MADYRQDTVRALYDQGLDNIVVTSVNEVKARDETIANLQAQLAERESEIARLDKLVYVPGVTKCAKCNFSQVSNTFHAGSGKLSANNSPQQCPNGCGPLWRVTERDAGNEMVDRCEAVHSQLEAARAQCERLRSGCNDLLNDCINFDGGKLTDCIMADASNRLKESSEQSLAEIEAREAKHWWKLGMANARRFAKSRRAWSNQRLFMELFGTGMTTARSRCIELGLDPEGNESSLNAQSTRLRQQAKEAPDGQ